MVKDLNAESLEQCPAGISLGGGTQSSLLVSIQSDLFFDEFYLLLKNDSGDKNLLMLRPTKLGVPTEGHLFPARGYCYLVAPGTYRISKIVGYVNPQNTGVIKVFSERMLEYEHIREITVAPNTVTYLGSYVLLDPRMKDKGYFGRMGAGISGMLTDSIVPDTIDINVMDALVEDSAWMLDEYKNIRREQIKNLVQ